MIHGKLYGLWMQQGLEIQDTRDPQAITGPGTHMARDLHGLHCGATPLTWMHEHHGYNGQAEQRSHH